MSAKMKVLTYFLLPFTLMVLVFQNFTTQSSLELTRLEAARKRAFAKKCGPNLDWEVCFEGDLIPGHNSAPHLWWQNPIDDDWTLPKIRKTSLQYNLDANLPDSITKKIMQIDRTDPSNIYKTGAFWRRDEFITSETGVVAEFQIKLLRNSYPRSVSFRYFDDKSQFIISFSPNEVSFSPIITDPWNLNSQKVDKVAGRPIDLTKWTNFKVVKTNQTLEVRLNGRLISDPVLWKPSSKSPIDSKDPSYRVSTIGLGDLSNNCTPSLFPKVEQCLPDKVDAPPPKTIAGAFAISYFRYKRAAKLPARSPRLRLSDLTPRRSPTSSEWSSCEPKLATTVRGKISSSLGWAACQVHFDPANSLPNLPDSGPFTLEITARLKTKQDPLKDTPEQLTLDFANRDGSIMFVLKKNNTVELMLGGNKPVKPAVYPLGFSAYEDHTYRIVRDPTGLYHYLYIDGKNVPVISDVREGGTAPLEPLLRFGNYRVKPLDEITQDEVLNTSAGTLSSADVKQIRWISQAVAP